MLQNALDLLDFLVFGNDSYFGPVRDIYLDDSEWIFRYIVIEMAEPEISSRHLISPLSVKEIRWDRKEIYVNLDIEKIRNSPEIDINLPISKQNEIAIRRYYEWSLYWDQSEFLDAPPLKGLGKPTIPFDDDRLEDDSTDLFSDDEKYENLRDEPQGDELLETEFGHPEEDVAYSNDLRSFSELVGYRLQTADAEDSFVTDLFFNSNDWIVKHLLVNLGNNHSGELVLLTLHWVDEINWSKSRIKINLTQAQISNAPRFSPGQLLSIEFERKTYNYYDSI